MATKPESLIIQQLKDVNMPICRTALGGTFIATLLLFVALWV